MRALSESTPPRVVLCHRLHNADWRHPSSQLTPRSALRIDPHAPIKPRDSEVPVGSCLGCMWYLIYIDDEKDHFQTPGEGQAITDVNPSTPSINCFLLDFPTDWFALLLCLAEVIIFQSPVAGVSMTLQLAAAPNPTRCLRTLSTTNVTRRRRIRPHSTQQRIVRAAKLAVRI